MNKTPWLTNQSLRLVHLLLVSYENTFGEPLLPTQQSFKSKLDKGKACYSMNQPIMAHDNTPDPCLIYANSLALDIWVLCWEEMIGMPSKLTAPKEEQAQRQHALHQATKKHAIQNYQGIRINSKGERFIIRNASIWTIWDEKNKIYGQAATFDSWYKI